MALLLVGYLLPNLSVKLKIYQPKRHIFVLHIVTYIYLRTLAQQIDIHWLILIIGKITVTLQ